MEKINKKEIIKSMKLKLKNKDFQKLSIKGKFMFVVFDSNFESIQFEKTILLSINIL